MIRDLSYCLTDPTGWEFVGGLLVPADGRLTVHVRRRWGFEIHRDGTVRLYDEEQDGWRDADWKEAARIRSGWIDAIGPDIARMAGVEPE